MSPSDNTEAGAIAELARKSQSPLVLGDVDGNRLALMPDGRLRNLDPEILAANPRRKRATVSLHETHSFIEYVKAHTLKNRSHLFGRASKDGGSFQAILDYHGDESSAVSAVPGWGEHEATLTLTISEQFARWLKFDRQPIAQADFAEFLEDNLLDIVSPAHADLLDVAQLLTGKKEVKFKSGQNLKTGAIQFAYSEEIKAGTRDDTLEVPDGFVIAVIPFVGAAGIEIKARLRYRIGNDGRLFFIYVLDRPTKVIEDAFELARQEIEEATGLKVHLGAARVSPVPNPTL